MALREFLRSRRAKITPEEAGLPPHPGTRRVPGLRREEVAQLAGVSMDYYIRLERGHQAGVSEAVLEALARALRLSEVERAHLFRIARPTPARHRPSAPQRVRPGLRLLLDTLTEVPVLVLGRRLDVLAANHLARALYTDFDALPLRHRNMAWLLFLDERVRALHTDWAEGARGTVASLRLYAGRHPTTPPWTNSSRNSPCAIRTSAAGGPITMSSSAATASSATTMSSSATSSSATRPSPPPTTPNRPSASTPPSPAPPPRSA